MKKKAYISAKFYVNIVLAVVVMLYFILINFAYYRTMEENLILGLKMTSGLILMLGIFFLELAYNKDNMGMGLNAIELLVLSGVTLSIKHIAEMKKINFPDFVVILSYVFFAYYIFKAIIVLTHERKKYLDSNMMKLMENNSKGRIASWLNDLRFPSFK